jgi:hypothetical protein
MTSYLQKHSCSGAARDVSACERCPRPALLPAALLAQLAHDAAAASDEHLRRAAEAT